MSELNQSALNAVTGEALKNAGPKRIRLTASELDYQTAEAVKMLRANVQFSGYGLKMIMLTSTHPNEGKSFVSFELARSLAALGKETFFLDCDIRKSVLQSRLGVTEKLLGLTDFLVGNAQVNEVLYKTNIPHLSMMFAGSTSPNPTELLSASLFARLCEALKKNYDYLIVDTPPLGMVIDAAIIAKQSDGVVMVIESGQTDRRQALHVKNQLETAGAHVLGVVLNKQGGTEAYYGKYGRYGSYGKYGNYYGYGETSDRKEKKR